MWAFPDSERGIQQKLALSNIWLGIELDGLDLVKGNKKGGRKQDALTMVTCIGLFLILMVRHEFHTLLMCKEAEALREKGLSHLDSLFPLLLPEHERPKAKTMELFPSRRFRIIRKYFRFSSSPINFGDEVRTHGARCGSLHINIGTLVQPFSQLLLGPGVKSPIRDPDDDPYCGDP